MTRPSWDKTWLALAGLMSLRSRCSSGAGCVIVDDQQRVVATGYAGPPATYDLGDDFDPAYDCRSYCRRARVDPTWRSPSYADCPSAHAEINALMFSDRSRVENGTLYVSTAVCQLCMKAVGNSGVSRVVWRASAADEYRGADAVIAYLERCQITVDVV